MSERTSKWWTCSKCKEYIILPEDQNFNCVVCPSCGRITDLLGEEIGTSISLEEDTKGNLTCYDGKIDFDY